VTDLFSDVAADRPGAARGLAARRVIVSLCALVAVLALANFAGQRATSSAAAGPAVRMRLTAPQTVRGGLFFQSRVEVRALRDVKQPRFVFDRGWVEGMQVNSIEPGAVSETSRDGRLVLAYAELKPGDLLRIWFQFEVDPTNLGHRSYALELDDATRPLARISRSLTVLP
jgi:hypothetical protein